MFKFMLLLNYSYFKDFERKIYYEIKKNVKFMGKK